MEKSVILYYCKILIFKIILLNINCRTDIKIKKNTIMSETKGKIGVTTENIFPVIKKFLYSDHEIFLRELVANAVDADQKMKALAASGEFKGELEELRPVYQPDSVFKRRGVPREV